MVYKNPFDLDYKALPDSLPVFPLKNFLLLPGGQIPLNIFEPRYINMVQDALAAKDRLVGIAMPRGGSSAIAKNNDLYGTGCASRITSFEETSDGRFLVTLTGYCRFELLEEVPTLRSYRRFSANWQPFKSDLDINASPDIDREKLISLLKDYANASDIEMDWNIMSEMPSFNLITFFSMSLPFEEKDQQALLESVTVEDRAEVLIGLIAMATKLLDSN